MGTAPHTLLSAAVEAARAVLRDLDADQVPNDLRRAVAASGALPPPLARSVLKGLEQYEWLRERAAEQLGDAEGPRGEAASLYLRRPGGWELDLVAIAAREGEGAGAAAGRASEGRERELAAALKAAKAKLKGLQRETAGKIAALERKVAELASERRTEAAGEARLREKSDQARAAAAAEAAELRHELRIAREEVAALQRAHREERSQRRKAVAEAAETAPTAVWVDDPAALAERLDHMAVMARPAARAGGGAAAAPPDTLRLPAGVTPDGRAAVEWLVDLGRPAVVLIDGYNVGYLLSNERSPGTARARVGALAQRLHTMGRGALRVTVVYDSNLGPAEAPVSPGPVAIRYSEAGQTADDEIVRLAGEANGPVVVISNDRAVRERSEAAGAVALWSSALAAWSTSR